MFSNPIFSNPSRYTSDPTPSPDLPDPWADNTSKAYDAPAERFPTWQLPLDPAHEIAAGAAPDGLISPGGKMENLLIPAHALSPWTEAIAILLQDEMKLPAVTYRQIWDQVESALSFLELRLAELAH
jgi:hypothetical protein